MPLNTDGSLRLAEITREMELKLAEYVGSAQSLLSPRMKAFAAFFIIPAFFPDMWRNPQLANRKAAVAQAVIAAIHFVCAKARGSQNVQPLQPIMAKFEEDTQSPYTFCIKSEDFKTETLLDCIVAFQAILQQAHEQNQHLDRSGVPLGTLQDSFFNEKQFAEGKRFHQVLLGCWSLVAYGIQMRFENPVYGLESPARDEAAEEDDYSATPSLLGSP